MYTKLSVVLFSLSAVFFIPSVAQATIEPWKFEAEIILEAFKDTDIHHTRAFESSSRQLIIAGGTSSEKPLIGQVPIFSDKVYFFAKKNDTGEYQLSKIAELPVAVYNISLHEIDGTLYAFGGSQYLGGFRIEYNMEVYRYVSEENKFVLDTPDRLGNFYAPYIKYFQSVDTIYRINYPNTNRSCDGVSSFDILSKYVPGLGWEQMGLTDCIENLALYAQTIIGDHIYFFGRGKAAKLNLVTLEVSEIFVGRPVDYIAAIPVSDSSIHLLHQDRSYGPPYGYTLDVFDIATGQLSQRNIVRSHYNLLIPFYNWHIGIDNGLLYSPRDIFGTYERGGLFRYDDSDLESNQDQIETLYWEVLYRRSDPGGLAYWVEKFNEGLSIDNIHESFTTSQERRSIVRERTANEIFMSVYGYLPDKGEFDFISLLIANGYTREEIITQIMQ